MSFICKLNFDGIYWICYARALFFNSKVILHFRALFQLNVNFPFFFLFTFFFVSGDTCVCVSVGMCVWESLSCVLLFATLWTVAWQAPLSMEFFRQDYWRGLPFLSPGALPKPGIEPKSPALHANALPSELQGNPKLKLLSHAWLFATSWTIYSPWNSSGENTGVGSLPLLQGIFPTQGSNPGLPYFRWIFHQLSYKGSPNLLKFSEWKLLSGVSLLATTWCIQSVEFSRPEYWSG